MTRLGLLAHFEQFLDVVPDHLVAERPGSSYQTVVISPSVHSRKFADRARSESARGQIVAVARSQAVDAPTRAQRRTGAACRSSPIRRCCGTAHTTTAQLGPRRHRPRWPKTRPPSVAPTSSRLVPLSRRYAKCLISLSILVGIPHHANRWLAHPRPRAAALQPLPPHLQEVCGILAARPDPPPGPAPEVKRSICATAEKVGSTSSPNQSGHANPSRKRNA